MERITIQIRSKDKAKMLLDFLKVLEFIEIVDTTTISQESDTSQSTVDFFSIAGIWQDRDISQESIRQKAWPRNGQ